MGLVGRTLRDDNEVHAAIGLFLAFLRRGFSGARRDPRSIHALFDHVLLGEVGAGLREFRGLGFLGIGIADDHQFGARIVGQTQGNVVAHALAGVVKPRGAGLVVAAIAGLRGLRRRRRLLHVHGGVRIGRAASAVAHRALHGVASGREPGRIKRGLGTIAGHLTTGRGVAVGQRIAIGIAGRRRDSGALAWHDRAVVGRARNRGWLIRLFGHGNVGGAGRGSALAVVHFRVDGVSSFGQSGGVEARIRSGAFDR